MELDYKAIGKRVKIARIKAELTQEQLAEKCSLSIPHISNIETGTTKASLSAFVHLANALSATVDDFLCDNLTQARPQFEKDMRQLLDDCSPYELRMVTQMAKSLVESLRKNERFIDSRKE